VNKTDLEQLADLRLAEAVALLGMTPQMPDAAYYLGGYAVECALKACIAKLISQHDFPDKVFCREVLYSQTTRTDSAGSPGE